MNTKKFLNAVTLLFLILLAPSCKKAFWENACDGIDEVSLSMSLNHGSAQTFQKGEKLVYTLNASPADCGGGEFDVEIEFFCGVSGNNPLQDITVIATDLWISPSITGEFEIVRTDISRISITVYPAGNRSKVLRKEDFVP